MSFDKKNFTDIYEAMQADTRRRIPELSDFEEGSVIRSLYESFAYEMALLYEQLDLVYQAGFVDTAEGAHLDRVVAVLGIKRNEPDFATGSVTFERDPGQGDELVIPIGTLLTTEEDEQKDPPKKAYLTIEEGRIPSSQTSVEVRIQAEERGKKMVTDPETIIIMPRPVPGIKSIKNKKPVRFLGRDRETDEELRQRAKQALLGSGRASSTSIENALLGQPGVREVRIKEDFPEKDKPASGKLGAVEVYVDGLTRENTPALRQRIDEVRAAGVYVLLKPAIAIRLEAILKVDADARISAEERLKLEENVVNAVEGLVQSLRMGQPLLFSQLSGEVLKIKGVKDLLEFQLSTYQEENNFARGSVKLTRGGKTGKALVIPDRSLLRTSLGHEFLLDGPAQFGDNDQSITASVVACTAGRAGELLRAGDLVSWEALQQESDTYTTVVNIKNPEPLLIEFARGTVNLTRKDKLGQELTLLKGTTLRTDKGREFDLTADVEFKTYEASVSASLQARQPGRSGELLETGEAVRWLDMQVKSPVYTVGVNISNSAAILMDADQIAAGKVTLTRNTKTGEALNIPSGTSVHCKETVGEETVLHEFLLKEEVRFVINQKTIEANVYAGSSGAGGELKATGTAVEWEALKISSPDSTTLSIQNTQPLRLLRTPPTGAGDDVAFGKLKLTRLSTVKEVLTIPAGTVFSSEQDMKFLLSQEAQFSATAKEIEVEVYAARPGQSNEIADSGESVAWKPLEFKIQVTNTVQITNAQPLRLARKMYGPNDRRIETGQILERFAPESVRVASELKPLPVRVQVHLLGKVNENDEPGKLVDSAAQEFFAGLKEGEPFLKSGLLDKLKTIPALGNFELRLVSFPFQSPAFEAEYEVPVSFVEKAQPEIVFTYSRRLELIGKMQLILPLTAPDEEKRSAIGAARQAIEDYLDSLGPETDINLEEIQAAASRVANVLRIEFQPDACALLDEKGKIIPDRIKDRAASVAALEKVFLAKEGFSIQA